MKILIVKRVEKNTAYIGFKSRCDHQEQSDWKGEFVRARGSPLTDTSRAHKSLQEMLAIRTDYGFSGAE